MARTANSIIGGSNVNAFLDTIAFSEIGSAMLTLTDSDDGYRVIVGSTPARMILTYSYTQHPRIVVTSPYGKTDAAGRYQVMAGIQGAIKTDTWDWASKAAGAVDFSPESQDLVAVYLIDRRGGLDLIKAGQFADAIAKCAKEWASLPSSGYGQRENKLSVLQQYYVSVGGTLA